MASDDFHVILYNLLKYLYACLKSGAAPDAALLSAESHGIPETYWAAVVEDALARGYVVGFDVLRGWNGAARVVAHNPRITMDGAEYFEDNKKMRRVAKFLREVKDTVPGM